MTFPPSSPFYTVGKIEQLTTDAGKPTPIQANPLDKELDALHHWVAEQRAAGIADQEEFLEELSDRIYRLLR